MTEPENTSETNKVTEDYSDLKQYVQETSSISDIALDSILSKLDTQNLIDLKEVLREFYEATEESGQEVYNEGYKDGFSDGLTYDEFF